MRAAIIKVNAGQQALLSEFAEALSSICDESVVGHGRTLCPTQKADRSPFALHPNPLDLLLIGSFALRSMVSDGLLLGRARERAAQVGE